MRACGQKLVKFSTHTDTHTHTTAAKLVVRMFMTLIHFILIHTTRLQTMVVFVAYNNIAYS